jgi:hypothetical protein
MRLLVQNVPSSLADIDIPASLDVFTKNDSENGAPLFLSLISLP